MRTLSTILLLLGMTALAGAVTFALNEPMYVAPSLRKIDPQLSKIILVLLMFCYALSALTSAYATWNTRVWAKQAYRVFSICIVVYMVSFLYIAPVPKDLFTLIGGAIFFGFLWWGLRKGWKVIGAAQSNSTKP
jgi:hypothetical protein